MNALMMILILALTTGVGCSRTATDQTSASNSTMSSASCVSTGAIDPSGLTIVGAEAANPGDTLNYKLSSDVGCVKGESVSWQMVNGKAAAGGVFTTKLARSGSFVITAQVQAPGATSPTTVSKQTTVSDVLTLAGPQVGMAYVDNTFTLVAPAHDPVVSAAWVMGDGATSASLTSVTHAYPDVGTYPVSVVVTLASGARQTLNQNVQIVPVREGYECTNQLAISGATTVTMNTPAGFTLFVPPCLTTRITRLVWTFGDGTTANDQAVTHAFATVGTFPVAVQIFTPASTTPYATLTTPVNVTAAASEPTPDDPAGNQCASAGLTRQLTGDIYTEQLACGVDGHRVNSYRDQINQVCQKTATILTWVETARVKALVDQGECLGQSCAAPAASAAEALSHGLVIRNGGFFLPDGGAATYFSSARPAGLCAEQSGVRQCVNGVLNGNTSATALTCESGCLGIGPSGTTAANQLIGQTVVPKTCAFGETGINDIFASMADKVCADGTVRTQNVHAGALTLAGVCPVYGLQPSAEFGACSADCGGMQAQIFVCADAAGNVVDGERCLGQIAPIVTRACDGNPAAVARVDRAVVTEQGGQSRTCPADQIGVVVQSRDVTTAQTFACVNHAVALVDTTVTEGAWVNQSFCRDYVAFRCSQDSLSNDQSIGRYAWMLKCQDQVPAIKDFLTEFASYQSTSTASMDQPFLLYKNRMVYATFMNTAFTPEKVWKAPVKASASCEIPATAYIAAVCTASCATPDQQILAEAARTRKLAYAPIGAAWAAQLRAVATLTANSTLSSAQVKRTPVDQWVTELVDGRHQILDFHLKSGGTLRLTPNHPVVTDRGAIKLASEFKVGENFVRLGGAVDPIVGIEPTVHDGKVYNVFVPTADPKQNVVVTNGYLNGTAFFQNDGAKFVNQLILRRDLVKGAL